MGWLAPLDIGLTMGLIFAWAVLSLSIALRLFNFPDLTVEGSFLVGAVVFAVLRKQEVSIVLAMVAGMGAGAIAGALTGFLHSRLRLNKFLAGIIVVAICYSVSLRVMGGSNIGLLLVPSLFDLVSSMDRLWDILHIGRLSLTLTLVVVGAGVLFGALSTRSGICLRAATSNPEYARSLGINVPMSVVVGLSITNSLAALGGICLVMYQGFCDVNMGQGVLILALAGMAIGERLVPRERLSFPAFVVVAAIVGSIVYQVIVAYAIRLGLAPTDLKLVTALLVLFVVALRALGPGSGDILFEEGS